MYELLTAEGVRDRTHAEVLTSSLGRLRPLVQEHSGPGVGKRLESVQRGAVLAYIQRMRGDEVLVE